MIYTVYSANRCQYCEMVKGLLKSKNLEFIEINIDSNKESKEWVVSKGHRTVPILYKDSEFIAAGYESIESFLKGK